MRLTDLEPEWLRLIDEKTFKRDAGLTPATADGVLFKCPKCFAAKGGAVGTHSIICWTPKVPQTVSPKPGRWRFEGTSLADLTLVAGSSSVALTMGCKAHFFIRKGEIVSV